MISTAGPGPGTARAAALSRASGSSDHVKTSVSGIARRKNTSGVSNEVGLGMRRKGDGMTGRIL